MRHKSLLRHEIVSEWEVLQLYLLYYGLYVLYVTLTCFYILDTWELLHRELLRILSPHSSFNHRLLDLTVFGPYEAFCSAVVVEWNMIYMRPTEHNAECFSETHEKSAMFQSQLGDLYYETNLMCFCKHYFFYVSMMFRSVLINSVLKVLP